jgi:hypothetical protein
MLMHLDRLYYIGIQCLYYDWRFGMREKLKKTLNYCRSLTAGTAATVDVHTGRAAAQLGVTRRTLTRHFEELNDGGHIVYTAGGGGRHPQVSVISTVDVPCGNVAGCVARQNELVKHNAHLRTQLARLRMAFRQISDQTAAATEIIERSI